jgi:Leucine-rich repeat (LRR) protein
MRALAVLAILSACGSKPAPVGPKVVAPVARVTPPAAPAPVSPWPVPMRVMTWTVEGVVQIGELPASPPKALPATPWYVEPTRTLDEAAFRRVVAAIRSEHVPGLSLRGQPIERWLGELRDLPELTALILDDTVVDAAALGAIDLSLRRLYLARTQVDDAAVATLRGQRGLDGLEVLDFEDTAVTDRGAASLVGFGGLHALNLAGTRITDAGGAMLGKLTKLSIVDLGGTAVGAKTIAAVKPLALRELFLDHTRVGKEIATLAAYAPGIARFDVSSLVSYKPTDADVAWLANAPNLVEVGLSGANVHDKLVLAIAAMPGLRELRLAGTPITLVAIKAIAKLDKLEEVDLAATPVDDASAAALLAMPGMRALRLDKTAITDAALMVKPSGKLVELYVSRTQVTDEGLAVLDATPKLEGLGLGETKIAEDTIIRIGRLSELRTLVLSKARTTRGVLAELGKLHQLERLYLDDCRATDETVAALAKLRELRVLHLAGTDVSDVALATLRTFSQLDELTVGDTRMRTAIANLDAWPRLRTLSLTGLDLTDDELPRIAKRSSLVTLDLSATEVRDPAKLATLPHLRVLGLAHTRLSQEGINAARALTARGVEVIR